MCDDRGGHASGGKGGKGSKAKARAEPIYLARLRILRRLRFRRLCLFFFHLARI